MTHPPDNALVRATPVPPLTQRQEALELQEATLNDFLPPVRPWVQASGWLLVGGLVAAVAAMAVWPYRVVVRGSGLVRPAGETSVVNAPLGGVVRSLAVQPNQSVRRGQLLAVLDPSNLQGRQQALGEGAQGLADQRQALDLQGESAVAAAEQEVAKAQAALRLAATEASRYQQLVASGAGSVQQMEEKQAAYSVSQANLAQARRAVAEQRSRNAVEQAQLNRQLSSNQADLRQVGRELAGTEVRAPVDGVVLSLALRNPRQVVAQGQELARIAPRGGGLVGRVLVPGQEISSLRPGQRADLKVASCPYPDYGTLPARVQAVAPDATGTAGANGARAFEVTLQFDRSMLQAGGRRCGLQQGMELEAAITTRQETVLAFVLRKARLWVGR
jgi:multidrug efflux pump subunit AcrA (membrane-fusion protein)